MTANITISSDVPDSTYFRTGSAEPTVGPDGLTIYSGHGTRRSSWGAPQVTSTIVVDAPDFVAVHVGFSHKHGGGQFWRYYLVGDQGYTQVLWKDLEDETRQVVLNAIADRRAPNWAKAPGKLRTQRKPVNVERISSYKVVSVSPAGEFRSLHDESVVYELGKTRVERARPDHRGGYYTYVRSAEATVLAFRQGELYYQVPPAGTYAVLECQCWGTRIDYGNGKISTTYCRPERVVEVFEI